LSSISSNKLSAAPLELRIYRFLSGIQSSCRSVFCFADDDEIAVGIAVDEICPTGRWFALPEGVVREGRGVIVGVFDAGQIVFGVVAVSCDVARCVGNREKPVRAGIRIEESWLRFKPYRWLAERPPEADSP
jgi:hypothetical protein